MGFQSSATFNCGAAQFASSPGAAAGEQRPKFHVLKKDVLIIGAGFSSLAAACYLAQAGFRVKVLEKNKRCGGRARQLKRAGFTFDIGPTFYWMPDVFERFFQDFGKRVSDYYELQRLNPGYQVYFGVQDSICIHENFEAVKSTFERIEPGSGQRLQAFIDRAATHYDIAMKDLVYKPGEHLFEIVSLKTLRRLREFTVTLKQRVASCTQNKQLRKILEFPVLFLGAKPDNTPAFYSFMNYADLKLGTWYPKGGMYEVIKSMLQLAEELGVEVITDSPVTSIRTAGSWVQSALTSRGEYPCDVLLSGADYRHTETLLPEAYRQYAESYWRKKTFAPSALLFYVGFNCQIARVSHHTLFFDTDFERHARSIYDTQKWPQDPLFYTSFPSKTDPTCAPAGKEAGIFLIPVAPDLEDCEALRARYFEQLISRLEKRTQQEVRQHVLFAESFCVNDFKEAYNACKGNAYGLANTLWQTHILRPRLKSNKLKNLYFTGQLTVPGPGVPPSLISGKLASELILRYASR